MKYKTVRIDKHIDGEWHWSWFADGIDREDKPTVPNPWGFFHFPETLSLEEGFETLRDFMVTQRQEEIEKLQKSIQGLLSLKMEGQ